MKEILIKMFTDNLISQINGKPNMFDENPCIKIVDELLNKYHVNIKTNGVSKHIGKVFGNLTVLYVSGMKGTNQYLKCKCICGNKIDVSASNLTSGKKIICGHCNNGKYENFVEIIKDENKLAEINLERKLQGLKSIDKYCLEIDED